MVNPFEETRQAGMQQGTPTWDQTSGITHPNLNGYQAWNATHSEGPSLEELRQYNNPNWEYNKAQVNLNEPSARAAEWEQFNKLRGQGYDPLEFLTRPMVTDEGLTDYNEFGDQQWDLMGEISPEMKASVAPDDWRTIIKILEAGGNPDDYINVRHDMGDDVEKDGYNNPYYEEEGGEWLSNPLLQLRKRNMERRREQMRKDLKRRMMEQNQGLQMDMLMNRNKFNTVPGTGDINPIFGDQYWNI